MNSLIEENLEAIRALARDYGVAQLEVFGSVCTLEFDPERSDVDFLVEYPPGYDFGPWLGRLQVTKRRSRVARPAPPPPGFRPARWLASAGAAARSSA
ncbi:MAG: nucleotidyltransferase domain-containing protein [Chloroflexia bacterium]|nr:nucleotidyltransferase domain-containing protein [Chloroflexia bacterium]